MLSCRECPDEKTVEDFYKTSRGKVDTICKDCVKKKRKQHYEENRQAKIDYQKRWISENRDTHSGYCSKWKKNNLAKLSYYTSKRRAALLNAEPEWLSDRQKSDIKAMYALAKKFEKLCGIKYHVDHIVPLQGEEVCGLHVAWNMQILPAKINVKKSNKLLEV